MENNQETIRIYVCTEDNKLFAIRIPTHKTSVAIKTEIEKKLDISQFNQEIYFNDQKLSETNWHRLREEDVVLMKKNENNIDFDPIKFKVKTLTGKKIPISIEPNKTVEDLKKYITEVEGIPPCQQRLIFNGFQMEEEVPLIYYEIKPDDFVHLVLRLRGGKPVIILYDNEKKENEEVTMKLKLNEDMEIGATYPQPIVLKEEVKEKEYEWKGKYTSKGNEENCKIEIEGKVYDYVFWEGPCNNNGKKFKGEVIGISKEKLIEDLEMLLEKLGLNEREINDFIVYWMTKLSGRKGHKVTICDEYYDNEIAKLEVTGFEKIHRVMLKFEEVEDVSQLANVQTVGRKERPTGKYVIEWGAILA